LLEQKKAILKSQRKGVDQFVALMSLSRFRKHFSYEELVSLWFTSFGDTRTRYFNLKSKTLYDAAKSELNKVTEV